MTDFLRTPSARARRRVPVCGVEAPLAPDLVNVAVAFAGPADAQPEEVEVNLRCVLQAHAAGEHHAFVMQLDSPDAGAVWASWTEEPPTAVEVRPDCPAVSPPGHGSEPCCEFAGHHGAHTYDTYDPWTPLAEWAH